MAYWLFKTEPQTFSIEDLASRANQTEAWDGVRNYQARNLLRDQVRYGDLVFIYHSSCPQPGIAGIARVVREAYPDYTQFDPESHYYDPKSSEENARWMMVDVQLAEVFAEIVSLKQIKANPALEEMTLVRKGNRLSIQPVTPEHWQILLAMAKRC
ncbi:EVE domain-containing protein [Lacimicrobium alkaliphilum]|uniref:Ubiquinol-cytochrome c reductase n=1 Tax=Lacimicrobium alkaliphilum TaxID=1526571 RepID=A0ABQ1RRU4_9ALTE|nr:EVE domain-containing protein [Lacimicrobium alkaliphilum]GGD77430.1 ubiquinol-cytochrome c reductase [Lacimicrobium alkaliphilum]